MRGRAIAVRAARHQRLQLWVVGAATLAGLLAVAVWAALQQVANVPGPTKAVAAAVAAMVPALGAPLVVALRDRFGQQAQIDRTLRISFRFWTPLGGPRVSDVREPRWLGVHQAALSPEDALAEPALGEPAYVRRNQDGPLDEALRSHTFVLVVGDSTAGKSRSAYEAMQRLLPDRLLLVPTEKGSLVALDRLEVRLPDCVLWLDELDRYLGSGGLTLGLLERLTSSRQGNITVLATMRAALWHDYNAESEIRWEERAVVMRAVRVPLQRRLDIAETDRAREAAHDPRIAAALLRLERYGLAEYLAAGPALLERFQLAQGELEPCGAAIVRAAVDWRRAGLLRPAPRAMLERLYPNYIAVRYPGHLGHDAFVSGLAWSMEPIHGRTTAALVMEVAQDALQAFDYLINHFEQRSDQYPVPRSTWEALAAELAEPEELVALGVAAYDADVRDIADQVWRRAAEAGETDAAYNLGVLLEEQGELEEAQVWQRKSVDKRERLRQVLESGVEANVGGLPELLAPLMEWGGLNDVHIVARLDYPPAGTRPSDMLVCCCTTDYAARREEWLGGLVTKRSHRDRLRERGAPLDEIMVVDPGPVGGQVSAEEIIREYALSVRHRDGDGAYVETAFEQLKDVSHIWRPTGPEDEFPFVVLRARFPPLPDAANRRIALSYTCPVPREHGYWFWTASSPTYVSTITIHAPELSRDYDCTFMKALPSFVELDDGADGTYSVEVGGWVLSGHGVSLNWAPRSAAGLRHSASTPSD